MFGIYPGCYEENNLDFFCWGIRRRTFHGKLHNSKLYSTIINSFVILKTNDLHQNTVFFTMMKVSRRFSVLQINISLKSCRFLHDAILEMKFKVISFVLAEIHVKHKLSENL